MKEPRVDVWCDACWHATDGERHPGEQTARIDMPFRRARTLDLCERHYKELVAPLATLLREKGVPPTAAEFNGALPKPARQQQPSRAEAPPRERAEQMASCPLGCGFHSTKSTVMSHLYAYATHNPHRVPRMMQPEKCPDCDYTSGAARAMVMHRDREHGPYDVVVAHAEYVTTENAKLDKREQARSARRKVS